MARVVLHELRKTHPDGTEAVRGLDLEVEDGELLVIVGPSGSGKTSTLRMIAGLDDVTSGEVLLDGVRANDVPVGNRDLAMVFPVDALSPRLTVAENLGFGLSIAKVPKPEITRRVRETAVLLGLVDVLSRPVASCSSGQLRRVSLGRAIVREPSLFLLDEPMSGIDGPLRAELRGELRELQQRLATTMVVVTHDRVEAMSLADRIAVLDAGRIVQVDEPQALHDRPANTFVATFFGSPGMNIVTGRAEKRGRTWKVVVGEEVLDVAAASLRAYPRLADHDGAEVRVGIRPEDIAVAGEKTRAGRRWSACTVVSAEQLGAEALLHLRTAADARVVVRLLPGRLPVRGDQVDLSLDPTRLHFFDAATGEALR